jgi:hypothetical protein
LIFIKNNKSSGTSGYFQAGRGGSGRDTMVFGSFFLKSYQSVK